MHNDRTDEDRSPIFLQFVECVYHLVAQFPTAFEFNERFLVALLDAVYDCRFGTFLHNNERERVAFDTPARTVSVWSFLLSEPDFRNVFYSGGWGCAWVWVGPPLDFFTLPCPPPHPPFPCDSLSALWLCSPLQRERPRVVVLMRENGGCCPQHTSPALAALHRAETEAVLHVSPSMRRLSVWPAYYLRYEDHLFPGGREAERVDALVDYVVRLEMEVASLRYSRFWMADRWVQATRGCAPILLFKTPMPFPPPLFPFPSFQLNHLVP